MAFNGSDGQQHLTAGGEHNNQIEATVAKMKDSLQQRWQQEATVSIRFLARASMVAVLALGVNDGAARQQGKGGTHNNQIKPMAEKMAFNCSGVGSEDGV
jgi:hypothetical protein